MTAKTEPGEKKESCELELLVCQAEGGDPLAIEQLKQHLSDGRVDAYMARAGDLALHAEAALLRVAAGEQQPLMRKGIQRKLDALRQELAGPQASPLERLLVERIVLCWAWANYLDVTSARLICKDLSVEMMRFGE